MSELELQSQMPSKYVVFDMETNGLLYDATEIHCIVMTDSNGVNRVFSSSLLKGAPYDGDIRAGVTMLKAYIEEGYSIVGHNILGYDLPLLVRMGLLTKDIWTEVLPQVIDTYVGVCLRFPEEKPGLEHWGTKFGTPKPMIHDWSTLTVQMVDRCGADVLINKSLLQHLVNHGYLAPKWGDAADLEQKVLWIHSQQVLHGMRVDILQAQKTLARMDGEIRRLEVMLHKELPSTCVNQGELKAVFKADGSLTHHVENWGKTIPQAPASAIEHPPSHTRFPDPDIVVRIGGPFSRIAFEPVNLNSHPQLKSVMLSLGWKPTTYNYKRDAKGQLERDDKGKLIPTTPKLTEDSYDSLPEGLGQNLATLLKLKHRRRFIMNEKDPSKGLLGFVRNDGRVECDAFTCGTNTGRYRHTGAFVNLPKISTPWGPEIRSLFCVPSDRWLVGLDLDGIEARVMGHYASFYDGGAFANVILKGDIHQVTADAMGIDRETAKTFRYAISYGAGVGKLREILNCSERQAKQYINKFWGANPGLSKLIEYLEHEYASKGHITGIDGRVLYIRHNHKLFNTLIQNAATVIFKRWMVKCYDGARDVNGVAQVLAYHDELGFEIHGPDDAPAHHWGKWFSDQARIVGNDMELNVPISAEYKLGKLYSEVH